MTRSSKSQKALDNRANQLNPSHEAYHRSRGAPPQDAQRQASGAEVERAPQPQPEANPASGAKPGGARR